MKISDTCLICQSIDTAAASIIQEHIHPANNTTVIVPDSYSEKSFS